MRLHIQPDIWQDYDPEKVRQGLKTSAGALKGVDIEALKKDIKNQRQQDSHGRPA
jgi:predicted nucleic acid-binding protein